jgi:phage tail tape-measure protein
MKTENESARDARNEDPITHEPGSHPVGVGVGTAAGAATGGAIGAVGGPIGAAAGAVVGGIAGAFAGKAGAEAVNPTVEDAYWREHHAEQDFADSEYTYDDYAPAYRVGYEGRGRTNTDFESSDEALRSDWEARKGESRLNWEKAKHAVRAGWHRVEARLPGDADKDGI